MSVDIDKLKQIVHKAAGIIRQARISPEQIRIKTSQKDFVTKYDIEVQNFLESHLAEAWPDRHFLGEEQEAHEFTNDGFIVDPIDGTANFVFGIPHYCISIAVLENGEIIQGVVYNPAADEMYWAELGQGSYMNGKRLANPNLALEQTVVGVG